MKSFLPFYVLTLFLSESTFPPSIACHGHWVNYMLMNKADCLSDEFLLSLFLLDFIFRVGISACNSCFISTESIAQIWCAISCKLTNRNEVIMISFLPFSVLTFFLSESIFLPLIALSWPQSQLHAYEQRGLY